MSAKVGVRVLPAAVLLSSLAVPATAQQQQGQQLSDTAVRTFMDLAATLQEGPKLNGTKQNGTKSYSIVAIIDRNRSREQIISIEEARDVIMVARNSAHAQLCGLPQWEVPNYCSLLVRQRGKKRSERQLAFIYQMHLAVVKLLTGQWRVAETDKNVVIDTGRTDRHDCTEEQKSRVRDKIVAYLESGPNFKSYVPPVAGPRPTNPPQGADRCFLLSPAAAAKPAQ
jgi:hypothetical protein